MSYPGIWGLPKLGVPDWGPYVFEGNPAMVPVMFVNPHMVSALDQSWRVRLHAPKPLLAQALRQLCVCKDSANFLQRRAVPRSR